jgi:hypothetical protein
MDGLQRSRAGKEVQREERDDMRARAVRGWRGCLTGGARMPAVEERSLGTDSGLAIVGPRASSSAGPNGSPRLLIFLFFCLFLFSEICFIS